MPHTTPPPGDSLFRLAARAVRLNPSIIRESLKVTEQPGVLSLAGGLPSPEAFPVQAMREASERVLRDTPKEALQYAASEGFGPLREWVAQQLSLQGLHVTEAAPEGAFTLPDVAGVAVVFRAAEGAKCERCWQVLPDVGTHKHPGTCARCNDALG